MRSGKRVLLVDDFEPFVDWVSSVLRINFEIVAHATDGLDGVQKAAELQPDVILLDIGLPKLDGIEAARRIREVAPNSRILFVSMETSADIVQEAIRAGGSGFVAKGKAASELLSAMESVLQGRQFISPSLCGSGPKRVGE